MMKHKMCSCSFNWWKKKQIDSWWLLPAMRIWGLWHNTFRIMFILNYSCFRVLVSFTLGKASNSKVFFGRKTIDKFERRTMCFVYCASSIQLICPTATAHKEIINNWNKVEMQKKRKFKLKSNFIGSLAHCKMASAFNDLSDK